MLSRLSSHLKELRFLQLTLYIVPKMPVPRMVAAVEAVLGQFYVAILVA